MTITKQLLILLLVEVTLLGGIAHLVIGLSPPLSILFVVVALLGLRTLVVLLTCGFSRFYPVPAIGWREWLSMVGREIAAYLLTFTWLLPFERWLMAPDKLAPSPLPLLLIHGYGCSRGIWRVQRTRLEAAGHTVATVTLTPPFGHLDDMVPLLANRIDEVLAATGASQLVLIGHSMGGLVCRDYLAVAGGDKVAQLITLATPIRAASWLPWDWATMLARWSPAPAGCSALLLCRSACPGFRCAPATTTSCCLSPASDWMAWRMWSSPPSATSPCSTPAAPRPCC
ncbi:esterase/lipase family protein [Aeromonas hydrophila]|uniref:esterase/lipase family protein n=1 Tax=Aeromonas hydrophila TaxID=644 RepID=UPI00207BC834|nr:alpha/beta fold hydrolase [Aeromonas hydrophila]